MLFKRSLLWVAVILWVSASSAQAINIPACNMQASKPVAYATVSSKDTLTVKLSGESCNTATVRISVHSARGETLYSYEGNLIEHMPFMIREPELNSLVRFYMERILETAIIRTTRDLPAYTSVDEYYEANNDFVVIPIVEYEALRAAAKPVLWHITGESSWVHSVYDETDGASKLIMRGGVFQ